MVLELDIVAYMGIVLVMHVVDINLIITTNLFKNSITILMIINFEMTFLYNKGKIQSKIFKINNVEVKKLHLSTLNYDNIQIYIAFKALNLYLIFDSLHLHKLNYYSHCSANCRLTQVRSSTGSYLKIQLFIYIPINSLLQYYVRYCIC